jgi:hypothetical protein
MLIRMTQEHKYAYEISDSGGDKAFRQKTYIEPHEQSISSQDPG